MSHIPPIKLEDFAVIKCNGRIVDSGNYQEMTDNASHFNTIYQTDEYKVERWRQ